MAGVNDVSASEQSEVRGITWYVQSLPVRKVLN